MVRPAAKHCGPLRVGMPAPQLLLLAWGCSASLVCLFSAECAAVYDDSHRSRVARRWPTASSAGGR